MLSPIAFYSPVANITKEEEEARKANMSIIIERYKDIVSTLPKDDNCWDSHRRLCKYQNFWYNYGFWFNSTAIFSVELVMALQDDFKPQPTNIFLTSHPKSGTTWLKSLAFAIINRKNFNINITQTHHPLLTTSPHDCVPFIETDSFFNNPSYADNLLATHIPYSSLPESIVNSGSPIVYICRNPKDVLISYWHFINRLRDEPMKLEHMFELFVSGVTPNGPFWDHVISYRKASLERPDKVLFLNYEDMKNDAENEVKKLAMFIGCPFTEEETVADIIRLCSFEELSKANIKDDDGTSKVKVLCDDIYFRKGVVGDSLNYLTPEMIQILDEITRDKYDGLDIPF